LIDQDLLRLGDRRLRVHIHGQTEAMYEPERLTRSAMRRFFQAAAAAASLTLGGTALAAGSAPSQMGGVGEPPPIEVRVRPPAVAYRVPVDCAITGQASKGGSLHVEASCRSTAGLRVGLHGALFEKKKGRIVTHGTVKITSIKGSKIRAVAIRLKKPVRAASKVRFWVSP
jgi:hypothetical protein